MKMSKFYYSLDGNMFDYDSLEECAIDAESELEKGDAFVVYSQEFKHRNLSDFARGIEDSVTDTLYENFDEEYSEELCDAICGNFYNYLKPHIDAFQQNEMGGLPIMTPAGKTVEHKFISLGGSYKEADMEGL